MKELTMRNGDAEDAEGDEDDVDGLPPGLLVVSESEDAVERVTNAMEDIDE